MLLNLVLVFWISILTVLVVQSFLHYRRLTKNISKRDLKTVLTQILDKQDLNRKEIGEINKALAKLQGEMLNNLQKVGFVRFNPFAATGGDQSFSLALLDRKNNGLVLSSMHSRESTRLYAKTLKRGKSIDYELSKEEQKAIEHAQ